MPQSVASMMQIAFRFPHTEASIDGAFQSLRYMNGLLSIARRHNIAGIATTSSSIEQEQQQETEEQEQQQEVLAEQLQVPEQGAILISHPCIPHWFSQSVVLVCQQTPGGGTYGLCLNKPLGTNAGNFLDRAKADQSSDAAIGFGGASTLSQGAFLANFPELKEKLAHQKEQANAAHDASVGEEGDEVPISIDRLMQTAEEIAGVRYLEDDEDGYPVIELDLTPEELLEFKNVIEAVEASYTSDDDGEGDFALSSQQHDDSVPATGLSLATPSCDDDAEKAALSDFKVKLTVPGGPGHVISVGSAMEFVSALNPGLAAELAALDDGSTAVDDKESTRPRGSTVSVVDDDDDSSTTSTEGGSSTGDKSSAGGLLGGLGSSSTLGGGSGLFESSNLLQTLMRLFAGSPLFRGGPVPGVQLLHRVDELGGFQVLGPSLKQNNSNKEADSVDSSSDSHDDENDVGRENSSRTDDTESSTVKKERRSVYLGAESTGLLQLKQMMEDGILESSDVKIFIGDSGWAPMQLETELANGGWTILRIPKDGFDIFDSNFVPAAVANSEQVGRSVWIKALSLLGPEYAALGKIPSKVWEDLAELQI